VSLAASALIQAHTRFFVVSQQYRFTEGGNGDRASLALTPPALLLSRELLKVLLLPPQAFEELIAAPVKEKA